MNKKVDFKQYLKNHPLAFEILSILTKRENASSTFLAKELGRSISTIYDSLSDMEKEGILGSKKEGVKTLFYPMDKLKLKRYLESKELQRAYAKASLKLRGQPISLTLTFRDKLAEKLANKLTDDIEIQKAVVLDTFTGKTRVDLLFKDRYGNTICIDLKRISHDAFLVRSVYQELGRIIDIVKGQSEINKLLLVFLLPSERIERFDYWRYKKLVKSFNTDKTRLEVITKRVDNIDLINPSFIEDLSEEIVYIIGKIK